jgi:predicted nucleic acid-binding protein
VIYLLDTSALIAHYRSEAGAEQVQAIFDTPDARILAASVSLPEFARRLRALGASDAEALGVANDYRLLLNEIVAIDERIALAAFEVACAASKRLPLVDALIAAAARERGACLVHRDDHMRQIPAQMLQQVALAEDE